MKKILKVAARIFKGLYDLFATYLLVALLTLSLISLLWFAIAHALAGAMGVESLGLLWKQIGVRFGISPLSVRLILFGLLHLLTIATLFGPLRFLAKLFERAMTFVQERFFTLREKAPAIHRMFGVVFTLLVTLLLIPFLLQPTEVGFAFHQKAWLERTANLLDGQATVGFADATVGFYRKIFSIPVESKGLQDNRAGKSDDPPMMARWNDSMWQVSQKDREDFAQLKAFMWVESGGQQFAVSRTGCLGLFQFCSKTAQDRRYRKVFKRGSIYACRCANTSCKVDKGIQKGLESGTLSQAKKKEIKFPCDLTDARFDGERSIAAGSLYVKHLKERFSGNLPLMYIAYNSGPSVAKAAQNAAGKENPSLEEFRPVLGTVLEKWYGDKAQGRAQGLLDVHIPKLIEAHRKSLEVAAALSAPEKPDK